MTEKQKTTLAPIELISTSDTCSTEDDDSLGYCSVGVICPYCGNDIYSGEDYDDYDEDEHWDKVVSHTSRRHRV